MLKDKGHEIIYAGYDAGISRCRNLLVKASTEPYIYWQDDDVCFISSTNLTKPLKILKNNSKIGVVGLQEYTKDKINHYEMLLNIENGLVIYTPVWENPENIKKEFIHCDMVINDVMAKREIFKEVMWDENLKLAEHLDFFLQLKYNTKWQVVYTNVFVRHQDIEVDNPAYKQYFRGRNKYFWQFYVDKWHITHLHNLEFKSNAPWKIYIFPFCETAIVPIIEKENSAHIESVEIEPIIIKEPIIEEKIPANLIDLEAVLSKFVEILNKNKCDYVIIDKTCAEMVCKGKLNTSPLMISINNFTKPLIEILEQNGFKFNQDTNCVSLSEIDIAIYQKRISNTKNYTFKNKVYRVPLPVISYLQKLDLWTV
jgi:hypothetical protein